MRQLFAKRLLVVDDERDITNVISKGLTAHGFVVTAYNDPVKALDDFKPGLFDLVLLDYKMPILDGFELYAKMSEIDRTVKYALLTAAEPRTKVGEAIFPELLEMQLIYKPVPLAMLAKHLESILSK